jgi:hypothetical protein
MHIELSAELRSSKANKLSDTISCRGPQSSYNPKQKEEMPLWRRHIKALSVAAALMTLLLLSSRVTAATSSTSSSKAAPAELYSCINDGQPDQQLTTYKDFAYQKPAR